MGLVVVLAGLVSSARASSNVVLMMADDLGWGDLGCLNPKSPIRTPHLDAMAAAGVRFQRFYAASAVCSPTRASCLTGRHPDRIGVPTANAGHLRKEEITLQDLLGGRGYRTGHFGKWHLGTLTTVVKDSNRGGPKGAAHFAPPWRRGFDVCFSTEAKVPTWDPMWRPKGAETSGRWWTPVDDVAEADPYGTRYWNEQGEVVRDGLRGDDSAVIMERALKFVRESAGAGTPFFAVIWFHSPHLPVVTGGRFAGQYSEYDGYRKSYYGCVTALDAQVGRLRAELRRLEVEDDTMVWFCADNGPEGNASAPGQTNGLRGRKRDVLEGGVRVPGILEWPGEAGARARVVTEPAVTSDYLPTILAATGVEYPAERPLDGTNLLPIIRGAKRAKPIGFHYGGKSAWMEGDWKIVRGRGGKGIWQLYNLAADPGEADDLAAGEPERTKRMVAAFEAWRASCRASAAGGDYREGA